MYDYLSFEMANSVVTSLDESESENILGQEIYPNPFHDITTIKSEGDFTYTISSLSGKLIERGNANSYVEIGANLEAGIYLVNILTPNKNTTHKIIKH